MTNTKCSNAQFLAATFFVRDSFSESVVKSRNLALPGSMAAREPRHRHRDDAVLDPDSHCYLQPVQAARRCASGCHAKARLPCYAFRTGPMVSRGFRFTE